MKISSIKINISKILIISILGLLIGLISAYFQISIGLFIIFILAFIFCLIILHKIIGLFKFKHLTIPGFFFLWYSVFIFPATCLIYIKGVDITKNSFLIAQIIFLLAFTSGIIVASKLFVKYKHEETKKYYSQIFRKSNNMQLTFFIVLIFSLGIIISYLIHKPPIALFYAILHPGAYLKIAQLRELGAKLFDVAWLRYLYSWAKILLFPLLTTFAYINYRLFKNKKWLIYFIVSLVLAMFIGALNFEKGPIANIFLLLVLTTFLITKNLNFKKIVILGLIGLILIFSFPIIMVHVWTGITPSIQSTLNNLNHYFKRFFYNGTNNIYNYFVYFPKITNGYLWGAGNRPITWLTGQEYFNIANYGSQTIMGSKIESGTNCTAFFVFDYINFGFWGILFGSFIVGFFLLTLQSYYVRRIKTSLNFIIYIFLMYTSIKLFSTQLTTWLLTKGVILLLILPIMIKIIKNLLIPRRIKAID